MIKSKRIPNNAIQCRPIDKEFKVNQIAFAPKNSDSTKVGAITYVVLRANEMVEWEWTHFPDGKSAVTGYSIKKFDANHDY